MEREFKKLVGECVKVMNECGFYLPSIEYKLDGRLIRALGNCRRFSTGRYLIKLSKKYFSEYLSRGDIHSIKIIILHEMCHSMPDGMNHGSGWMQYTRVVNTKGYNIQRLAELDEVIESVQQQNRIKIGCSECDKEYSVSKRSKYLKTLPKCICGKCGHVGFILK